MSGKEKYMIKVEGKLVEVTSEVYYSQSLNKDILNRPHLLCQQIRSVRAAGMRGMRNPVSKVYLETKWED